MTKKEKAYTLMYKMGMNFVNSGSSIVRGSFRANKKKVSKSELRTALANALQLKTSTLSLSDEQYFLTDWDKWREIIELDFVDKIPYKADFFDCDNFSLLFSSRAAELYGLNTAMTAFGEIRNPQTNVKLGRHAFNIVAVNENDKIIFYGYEPITDMWTKITTPQFVIGGAWKYVPDWVIGY